jgi:hypothetical protein
MEEAKAQTLVVEPQEKKTEFVPHRKYYDSAIKPNRLLLFGKTIRNTQIHSEQNA